MGKVASRLKNPLRNFNIEDRAHKVISREKPIAAPKYQSDIIDYERILKNHPEVVEDSLKKHEELNKYLKDVYVTSKDPAPIIQSKPGSERPLPLDRTSVKDFELGFKESDNVRIGKASLRTIMKFIGMYQNNPKENTAQKIASEHNLDEEKVRAILKYVRVFEIYIPENQRTKAQFAGPSIPKPIHSKIPHPMIPSGKDNDEKT